MDEMKYREMYFHLHREVRETIRHLEQALWESERKLAELSMQEPQGGQKKQGGE